MFRRESAYRCPVCGWQGAQEPGSFGGEGYCPECGTLMYPMSWASTWGVVLLLVAAVVGVVAAVAWWR